MVYVPYPTFEPPSLTVSLITWSILIESRNLYKRIKDAEAEQGQQPNYAIYLLIEPRYAMILVSTACTQFLLASGHHGNLCQW